MARNPIKVNNVLWQDYLSAQRRSLPPLDDVSEITGRVSRVLGGNPGEMQLQGTNTYLVGTGTSRILIDTGEGKPLWAKNIKAVLEDNKLDIAYVLLTHWHGDHTGGVSDLITYRPELASRVFKNTPDPGQQPIVDGQVFRVEGATIRAVFTPGHAVDHMCFQLEEENALFTGDNVLGHGYSVEEDLGAYMRSLYRMSGLGCAVGYPAHGAEIADLPQKMLRYLRHKELRETQVWNALVENRQREGGAGMAAGSLTVRELVEVLHGDALTQELSKVALEPFVTQVLWKLAEDRRVGFRVVKGTRRWFSSHKTVVPTAAA